MRYIKDIPNKQYKISLFQWNGKYIIKFEAGGHFEQTFKMQETDILHESDIDAIIDERFLEGVTQRFVQMARDLQESCQRNEIL